MRLRILAVTSLLILINAGISYGIDFSGSYLIKTPENSVTLTLRQTGDGQVAGILSSTTGSNYKVSGTVDEDVIVGFCEEGLNSMPFEAHFESTELLFTLIGDSDENSSVIKFPLAGKKLDSASQNILVTPSQRQNNGLSHKMSLLPKDKSSIKLSENLIGNYICRTAEGNMTLQILNSNQLLFNGDPAEYRIQDGNFMVMADGETLNYPFTMNENELIITFPEGFRAAFVKDDSSVSQFSDANGGAVISQLIGRWKDVRSSGNTVIQLLGNGQYTFYTDYVAGNSQAGQTNWGFGNSSEDRGTWIAKGTPQQGTIYYQSQKGESNSLTYHVHMERGKPFWNEYIFDGKLYCKE